MSLDFLAVISGFSAVTIETSLKMSSLDYFIQLTVIKYEGRIKIIADKQDLFFLNLHAHFLRKVIDK